MLKSDKRAALEKKALDQMRKTRKQIDPEVLAKFRDVIAQSNIMPETMQEPIEDYEIVDKRKTYETILKFAQLRKDNQAFMNEIFKVLGNSPKH